MFDLPNAKKVKRSEMFSSLSSSDESEEDPGKAEASHHKSTQDMKAETTRTKALSEQSDEEENRHVLNNDMKIDYGFEYDYVDKTEATIHKTSTTQSSSIKDQDKTHEESQDLDNTSTKTSEQTYAFNLFAPKPTIRPTTTNTSATTPTHPQTPTNPTRITIRSPSPELNLDPSDTSSGRILRPRPQAHYFTSHLPTSTLTNLKSQYLTSAISGTTILSNLSTTKWPGTSLPWRVISISIPMAKGDAKPTSSPNPPPPPPTRSVSTKSRPKPSKKRRILLRSRHAAREATKAATVKNIEDEKEKRTRRNREKKVKRKMREKAKKVGFEAEKEEVQEVRSGDGDGVDG